MMRSTFGVLILLARLHRVRQRGCNQDDLLDSISMLARAAIAVRWIVAFAAARGRRERPCGVRAGDPGGWGQASRLGLQIVATI